MHCARPSRAFISVFIADSHCTGHLTESGLNQRLFGISSWIEREVVSL